MRIALTNDTQLDSGGLEEDLLECWRDASEDAAHAYAYWCAASRADRSLAYAVYVAAADREAAAAEHLRNGTRA